MNRMADDIHLIATPFRWVGETLKLLLLVLGLPLVFIISFIYWLITGKLNMSPDDLWLTKVLFTVLRPWIMTLTCIFNKHFRVMKGHEYRSPVPNFIVFVATILIMLVFIKCNSLCSWGFYSGK